MHLCPSRRSSPLSVSPAIRSAVLALGGLVFGLVSGCDQPPPLPAPVIAAPTTKVELDRFSPQHIGRAIEGKPWISHVNVADLDRDGRMDILACDDQLNAVVWLRQSAPGRFEETTVMADLASPVHVEAVDMDGDGDLDLLVSSMGQVFPNNDKIGSVIILENNGRQQFIRHTLLERVARVTDLRAGDFDGDGKPDLAVAQFGYNQGEIRWMRNKGNWQFDSQILLSLPGTINVCVADLNGDRTLDIVALVSQQYEEIYLFENSGFGTFTNKILFGSTNEDYGSSGISLCDLNRDGRPDILYTNGDGFAYADPGKRSWHGLQWLENGGQGFFKFHRIGDMAGAYSPIGVDLEGRGVMDIVCVSGFNDWKNPKSASLVLFRNDGKQSFTPIVLAHQPIQLISVAAGDLDGSGRPSLVTGAFFAYPPFDNMARLTLWRPRP
ncbi:MAG: VCBS repeat-containing protein [Opitutaceae bacterium]